VPRTTGPWFASSTAWCLSASASTAGPSAASPGRSRHQRQPADPHHVVGRDRRDGVRRVDVGQAADRHRIGRVEVDHRPRRVAPPVHPHVQERLLGRRVARDVPARVVQLGEPAGSSRPRLTLVGVITQPSPTRALRLPELPKVSPRSNSDLPKVQISSRRRASSLTASPPAP
jgi:hypothetical protein